MPSRYEANGSMGTAMIANRVSWYFDIKGPSISLDIACSSSLVALHLACQSIRTGETKAVGTLGVTPMLSLYYVAIISNIDNYELHRHWWALRISY